MTDVAAAHTDLPDATAAGQALGAEIAATYGGEAPQAVILFASSRYDYPALLQAVFDTCHPGLLVGCSSAGEFTDDANSAGAACALALRSSTMQFAAGVGRGLRADRAGAARELVASFQGLRAPRYPHRAALLLTDALAGQTEDLLEHLTVLTGGTYRFFGGGAGDDARFQRTHVFCGHEAIPDAVVGLEILSSRPIGIGVGHGWEPASPGMRVTEAAGSQLYSLNAVPAAEVFEEHAEATGQVFDSQDPLPFFLHNVLGIVSEGQHKLRVPLGVGADESIACAADVPPGATAHIMRTSASSTVDAAARATRAALAQLQGHPAKAALFFDCAATRLRLGQGFGTELRAVEETLGPVSFAGCNTYGQIARADGQFSGFHNCTAVVCVLPD
ncbi:MAG TPA: FIST N-terminal domain-containing protein [Chloroflexota bacterium]|nr:FIST N-terminal domain-containing protein [Chloroflexota bacterium]